MNKLTFGASALAVVLGLAAPSVRAEQWDFTFHNLHHVYYDLNSPDVVDYGYVSLPGSFTAIDLNHDQTIDVSEVSLVSFLGVDYINERNSSGGWSRQDISVFSYDGTTLKITAEGYRASFSTSGGAGFYSGGYNDTYGVGPTTTMTVQAVPEPAMFLLWSMGLLGIACLGIRREWAPTKKWIVESGVKYVGGMLQ